MGASYYKLCGAGWFFADYMLEPAQERHPSFNSTADIIDRITGCFGHRDKPFGNLPLINESQLLTNIKLD